ncbi:hypothetical protein HWV62_15551 [Athelia sp. TMB]|nr:hypothetical protein HWV62_15551 [Athelia sp. TMB]
MTIGESQEAVGMVVLESGTSKQSYTSFELWSSSPEIVTAAKKMYGGDIANLELYTYGLLVDLVESALTKWGFNQCSAGNDDNGASGAVLPTLLIRHLSSNYPYANIYSLFPFIIPSEAEKLVRSFPKDLHKLYDLQKPEEVISLGSSSDIYKVFEDSENYSAPYGNDLALMTEGAGFLLGFDDKQSHDSDKLMILYSLIPDRVVLSKYATSFRLLTERFISEWSKSSDKTDQKEVDIVSDVVNRTCAKWVCDTIRYQKEDAWIARKKALVASKRLSIQIKWRFENIAKSSLQESFVDVTYRWCQEYTTGAPIGGITLDEFLERIVYWMDRYPSENLDLEPGQPEVHEKSVEPEQLGEKSSQPELDRKRSGQPTKEHEIHPETNRIVANVLCLTVMTCASFAQVCSHAVDFYLRDERANERSRIMELSEKKNPRDNAEIMGYIREAQRMEQSPILTRIANRDMQISQELSVRAGDCVVADFKKIHMNPAQHPNPEKVEFARQTPSIQGLGSHRCPGVPFVDAMFKAIFRLKDLRKITSNSDKASPSGEPQEKADKGVKIVFKPLRVQYYDKSVQPSADSNYDSYFFDTVPRLRGWPEGLIGQSDLLEGPSTQQNTECNYTTITKPYHKYQPFSLVPEPGSDKPLPYKYTTKDKKPHRMTIMDADQRDMQFTIWIDDVMAGGTSDFVLDKSVDCGEVAKTCWRERFSMGIVDVPSGKHTVEIRWAGKGTSLALIRRSH